MYAIEEGLQKINGEMVETFEREVTCGNTVLEVEAGITIACCGDDGLNAIMKALEFAHEAINDQRCEVDD